jgi:hypothetical protein
MRAVPAAALLLAAAAAAAAQDAAPESELDRTKRQVEELLRRVQQLEGRDAAAKDSVERAVRDYLEKSPPAPRGGGNVTAPGVKSLKFSGQVLTWWERWDGTYRATDPLGSDVQDVGWLRVFLRADAEITDDLRARVEVRDARAFGQETATNAQLQANGAGLDLKEGWFEAEGLPGDLAFRAGRFTLGYGDERLVGELDWHTYGRSFDGAHLSRIFGRTKAELFGVRVLERGLPAVAPGADNDDQDFYGLHLSTPRAIHHSDLDVYAFHLADRMRAPGEKPGESGNTGFTTAGLRVTGSRDALDWGAEAAVQAGSLAGDGLRAHAFAARAGWTFADAPWAPRVGVEIDRATGDEDPTDGDRESFQTLFPTNHRHYGILDLMAWQNMRAAGASLRLTPATGWTVDLAAWKLALDESADAWYGASGAVIRGGAAGADEDLGTELDLVVAWKMNEHFRAAIGGSHFRDGPFVRDTGGGGDTLWLYVRLQVDF